MENTLNVVSEIIDEITKLKDELMKDLGVVSLEEILDEYFKRYPDRDRKIVIAASMVAFSFGLF